VSSPPPQGARGRLIAGLTAAAAVSAASTWVVVHATWAAGPEIASIASSPLFLLGATLAFGASVWALRLVESSREAGSPLVFAVILAGAVILRLVALPAPPGLSDDIYRYMWDGHVQAAGIDPYLHAPNAHALDPLQTPYRALINNPGLPTIYPPVSQIVFLLAALAGGSLLGLKTIFVLFDLGTIAALAAILRHRGLPASRVVIYAWSPLAVVEVAWSGHQDAVGVFLMTLGLLFLVKGRGWLAACAGTLSGAAKYIGWLLIPVAARQVRWMAWLPAAGALLLVYLPYLRAGRGVTGSLRVYAEVWRFNDSLFAMLAAAVEWLGLGAGARRLLEAAGWVDPAAPWEGSPWLRLTDPLSVAKLCAALIFVAFAARVLRRPWSDPVRGLLALAGSALLLSPTVHPWYLLWIAPLMALAPRASWLWLTWAVLVFSYPMMAARLAGESGLDWLAWPEYLPFFLILAIESARRRLWEMDGEGWSRIV
jgi:hypothetical protein